MTILPQPPGATSRARHLAGQDLADALRDSRARTLAFVMDLNYGQWLPERQRGVNPVAWELGHLAWFAEFWTLRGPHHLDNAGFVHATRPAVIVGPDEIFDSARLAHARRWEAPLPSRATLVRLLEEQLQACIDALPDSDDDAALYFHRLSLFHEDMHAEAFAWMRAALGYPAPVGLAPMQPPGPNPRLRFDAPSMALAPTLGTQGFQFDNEMRSEPIAIAPFDIDARCVTAGEFLAFVAAGGYECQEFWPAEAGHWRTANAARHPSRWRAHASGWQVRHFDEWQPLDPSLTLIHVNAYEAEAYCTWKGRRLPRAVEWEIAAAHASEQAFSWGHSVWEWTSDPFAPYAGFTPGPYRDYSMPWFGDHRELRGGAFATHARMHDARYRNFFQPHRADVFAGFRTASSQ